MKVAGDTEIGVHIECTLGDVHTISYQSNSTASRAQEKTPLLLLVNQIIFAIALNSKHCLIELQKDHQSENYGHLKICTNLSIYYFS